MLSRAGGIRGPDRVVEVYETFEDVVCTYETDKALLCIIAHEERWVPKSQIRGGDIHPDGDVGVLMVSDWIVRQWEQR